jgi:hypothetical protein
MKTTPYFDEQVLRKRPYINSILVKQVLKAPLVSRRQTDGRWRLWGLVTDPRDGKTRALRVVILEDGETVHNAFYDRDFKGALP